MTPSKARQRSSRNALPGSSKGTVIMLDTPTRLLPLSRCSINTATLGHRSPIGGVIERVARHGFGGISPWRRDLEGQDHRLVGRHLRDAGLSLSGYCRGTY